MASTFQRQTRQGSGGYQQPGGFGAPSGFRPQILQTQGGSPYMPNPGSFAFGMAQPKTGDVQQGGLASPPSSGGSGGFEAYRPRGSYSQPSGGSPSSQPGGYATTMAMGEEDGFGQPPQGGGSRKPSFGPDSPTWNDPRNDKARDRYYERQQRAQQEPDGYATTMAMGEEDGFGQQQPPPQQPPAPPQQPGGYATTMAMGEEDGFGGGPLNGTPPETTQFGGQTYTTGGGYPMPGVNPSPAGGGFQQVTGQQYSFAPDPIYDPFQTASLNFDGTVTATPNYNQRDAFINNINNSLGNFWMNNRTNPQAPPPQFDFNSLWTDAGRMAQNGWQNPLAGLFM